MIETRKTVTLVACGNAGMPEKHVLRETENRKTATLAMLLIPQ